MDFPSDFQHIETASRTPAKDIQKELTNLNTQVKSLMLEQKRSVEELESYHNGSMEIDSQKSDNLLSTALLTTYTQKLDILVSQFPAQYNETETCVTETMEQVSKLAKYFGENPLTCSSEKVFISILQFVSVFKLSKEKVIRTRHSKNKQKAAASGGGGKAEDKVSPRTKGRNAMSAIKKRRSSIAGRDVSSSSESDSDDGSDWDKSPAKTKSTAEAK